MSHRTSDEMLADYTAAMGPKFGPAFHRLYNDNAWLHMKWNDFIALFAASPAQMRDLNTAAPGFFRSVQDAWWDDILLHIFRMTDRRKGVLSVYTLLREAPPAIRPMIQQQINVVEPLTEFARDARHAVIAHRSLEVALGVKTPELGSRKQVREALEAIDTLLLAVERHYVPSTQPTNFDLTFSTGGIDQILDIIERGLKSRDARFGTFRNPHPADDAD